MLKHLSEALDKIRKQEYARLSGQDRKYIKGQKHALLSHLQNLSADARKNSKRLLAANKRLNTAYLLKQRSIRAACTHQSGPRVARSRNRVDQHHPN